MFKDKTILITGGTGSFGRAVLNRFLNTVFVEFIKNNRLLTITHLYIKDALRSLEKPLIYLVMFAFERGENMQKGSPCDIQVFA